MRGLFLQRTWAVGGGTWSGGRGLVWGDGPGSFCSQRHQLDSLHLGKPRAERTSSAGQSLAAALQQLLLKLLHPLGILLVSLLTEGPDALHKLGGVNVLRHGCGRDSRGPGGRLRSWSWCWAKEVWIW